MPTDNDLENVDPQVLSEPTELMFAAQCGDLGQVQALIAAGAQVNAADRKGMTPLLHAAERGHVDIMRALITAGANIHAVDCDRTTALMLAAYINNLAAVQCMLDHDVDVNAQDKFGRTALIYSLDGDKHLVADELLGAGARVDMVDNTGVPMAAQAAAAHAQVFLERLLRAGADPNACNWSGSTPLMCAVDGEGKPQGAVALLIHYGAEIDAVDQHGNSALMRAALAGKWDVVAWLEAHGASRALANLIGTTPGDVIQSSYQNHPTPPYQGGTPMRLPLAADQTKATDEKGVSVDCLYVDVDPRNQAFDESRPDNPPPQRPHLLAPDEVRLPDQNHHTQPHQQGTPTRFPLAAHQIEMTDEEGYSVDGSLVDVDLLNLTFDETTEMSDMSGDYGGPPPYTASGPNFAHWQ